MDYSIIPILIALSSLMALIAYRLKSAKKKEVTNYYKDKKSTHLDLDDFDSELEFEIAKAIRKRLSILYKVQEDKININDKIILIFTLRTKFSVELCIGKSLKKYIPHPGIGEKATLKDFAKLLSTHLSKENKHNILTINEKGEIHINHK